MTETNYAYFIIDCFDKKTARHLDYSGPFATKEQGIAALEAFVRKIIPFASPTVFLGIFLVKIYQNGFTNLVRNKNAELITGELIRKQLNPQNQVIIS
jgi:hypothetical protein